MRLAQVMGTLLFIAGLTLVIYAVLATVVPTGTVGDFEKILIFGAGVFTLLVGGYMAERTGR